MVDAWCLILGQKNNDKTGTTVEATTLSIGVTKTEVNKVTSEQ